MKRILLALTLVGLLLPLAPRVQADTEVSLNFFYDNLSAQGNWIEVADYGYAFQPAVAVSNPDWRPYADGYWAYTDAGWTWVSYEDFGWATYHYGRWANLDSYGWVWVPGYEWGPAWVSWRTGGDYVGWAPLPPQGGSVVYEGRAITGDVDITFGIGPLYYNFVDIRYIGEPVLRGRLIEPSRNVTIINNTVNVTNITYNNSIVINNGPDLNRVNEFSTRPIQRLTLQRETSVAGDFASRRGNLNRVSGSTLMVAAPAVQRSQQQLAPKQVKAKVDKPKFEKGWQGINNRQQVEQEMKKANAQNVPPPTFQPKKDRKGEGAAAAAGQNAGAQPNGSAPVQPAPAAVNDQEASKAARRAQRDSRDQNAGQPRENRNAEQAAAQEKLKNAREQRTEQADQPKADRTQQMQERKARQDAQRPQQQQAADTAGHNRAEKRAQEAQAQPARAPQRAEQAPDAERAARARSADQAQEPARANRAEQAQEAQRPARAQQRNQPPDRPERVERPDRAERPQVNRPPAQARPPQESQAPTDEHKGRKKKPGEEPSPQP